MFPLEVVWLFPSAVVLVKGTIQNSGCVNWGSQLIYTISSRLVGVYNSVNWYVLVPCCVIITQVSACKLKEFDNFNIEFICKLMKQSSYQYLCWFCSEFIFFLWNVEVTAGYTCILLNHCMQSLESQLIRPASLHLGKIL